MCRKYGERVCEGRDATEAESAVIGHLSDIFLTAFNHAQLPLSFSSPLLPIANHPLLTLRFFRLSVLLAYL